jgi:hypothetical protein
LIIIKALTDDYHPMTLKPVKSCVVGTGCRADGPRLLHVCGHRVLHYGLDLPLLGLDEWEPGVLLVAYTGTHGKRSLDSHHQDAIAMS